MLGCDQTLQFLVAPEVHQKIQHLMGRSSEGISVRDVMLWVLANTIEANMEGLAEWAANGALFAAMRGAAPGTCLPEDWDLGTLYGAARVPRNAAKVIAANMAYHFARGATLDAAMQGMAGALRERVVRYGSASTLLGGSLDTECERELEQEAEQEAEQERQLPRYTPRTEQEWDFSRISTAAVPQDLPVALHPLAACAAQTVAARAASGWPPRVLCTGNFLRAVEEACDLDDLLRPVDGVLVFQQNKTKTGPPEAQWLLVSSYEADHLLPFLWDSAPPAGPQCMFATFAYARRATALHWPLSLSPPAAPLPAADPRVWWRFRGPQAGGAWLGGLERQSWDDDEALAALQLWMGECMYHSTARRAALEQLLEAIVPDGLAPPVARALVTLRGMDRAFERSDLARVLARGHGQGPGP